MVRSQAALHKDFQAVCLRRPLEPLPRLRDEGLTLGRGTLLTRRVRPGLGDAAHDQDAERVVALLSTVYGQPVDAAVVDHVTRCRAASRFRSSIR